MAVLWLYTRHGSNMLPVRQVQEGIRLYCKTSLLKKLEASGALCWLFNKLYFVKTPARQVRPRGVKAVRKFYPQGDMPVRVKNIGRLTAAGLQRIA